jgi:hypothetical protein
VKTKTVGNNGRPTLVAQLIRSDVPGNGGPVSQVDFDPTANKTAFHWMADPGAGAEINEITGEITNSELTVTIATPSGPQLGPVILKNQNPRTPPPATPKPKPEPIGL